jgi:Lrp/AsnC family leucine-responsive transcriptional regulator
MVGLSYAPCAERINRLEEMQVIKGYRAHLNANLLDASLLVFIEISFDSKTDQNFEHFKQAIQGMVHILECYLITGEFDFLIKVRIKDITEYRKMITLLLGLPNIIRSRSAVVMEELKDTTAIPIGMDAEDEEE